MNVEDAPQTAPLPRAIPATARVPVKDGVSVQVPASLTGAYFEVPATPAEGIAYRAADDPEDVIIGKIRGLGALVTERGGRLHGQATVREAGGTFTVCGHVTPARLVETLENPPPEPPPPPVPSPAPPRRPRRHGRRAAPPPWPTWALLALTVALGAAAWATAYGLLPLRPPWWAWLLPLTAWLVELPFPRRSPRRVRRSLDRSPVPQGETRS